MFSPIGCTEKVCRNSWKEISKYYVNALSIIKTLININPFESIKKIFHSELLFA